MFSGARWLCHKNISVTCIFPHLKYAETHYVACINQFLMRSLLIALILCTFSVARSQQKDIIIPPELDSHSEMLKVKMGAAWFGKIYNFQFGEYAIISSKNGVTKIKGHSNFLETKSEEVTERAFSFVMRGESTVEATVNAGITMNSESIGSLNLFSFDSDEGLRFGTANPGSESFTIRDILSAFITLSNDTSTVWSFLLKSEWDMTNGYNDEMLLTNGQRQILVSPVTSNDNGTDKRQYPALGFVFRENDKPLSAVQHFGGGLLGQNKSRIWIHDEAGPDLSLVLAAAMTTILEYKAETAYPDESE